jgi:hypothetical protein
MVILVLLVLTVLGVTAAMLMTQEDRISSRQDLQKAALYTAEAGLREGENIFLGTVIATPDSLSPYLAHTASSVITAGAPDPVPVQPVVATDWDVHHLGTYLTTVPGGATEVVNHEVVQLVGGGETFNRIRAYYSLYVRNNPEDRNPTTGAPDPTHNYDYKLRLISVGFITDGDGVAANGTARVLAAKVLEEEYNWLGAGNATFLQKGLNQGNTNAAMVQRGFNFATGP